MRTARPRNAKLTAASAAWAKRKVLDGVSRQQVADALGVHKGTIDQMMIGRTWGHVPPVDIAPDVWHGEPVNGQRGGMTDEQTDHPRAEDTMQQVQPVCEHCGKAIELEVTRPDCCHRQTAEFHTLQLDSARNAARHIVYLRKLVESLSGRVAALEAKPRKGKA